MNVLIRCDSSNIIGTGHVMRCLNLTEYNLENKYTFVCRKFDMNIGFKILNAGHELMMLDYLIEPKLNNYLSWLGFDKNMETIQIKNILLEKKYDQLIIDHYGYDESIEKELLNYVKKITVITDIFDSVHWCNEFINYNSDDVDKIKSINLNPNTEIKCGVSNIIINKKFKNHKKTKFNNKIEKICIMLGGSDPTNYTLEILKYINEFVLNYNIHVYIVIGKSNNNIDSIKSFVNEKQNYECLFDLSYDKLIKLYLDIDLCIGSLSITAYERLFMKVPQICLKIVENQNIQQLKEFNICSISNINKKLIQFE